MEYKNIRSEICCNLCGKKDGTLKDNPREVFKAHGWEASSLGNLCKECSERERNLSEEKKISKEVKYIHIGYGYENERAYDYHCPSCGNKLSIYRDESKICGKCSQRVFCDHWH